MKDICAPQVPEPVDVFVVLLRRQGWHLIGVSDERDAGAGCAASLVSLAHRGTYVLAIAARPAHGAACYNAGDAYDMEKRGMRDDDDPT